jgi:tungstate transport system substrate-binding protein
MVRRSLPGLLAIVALAGLATTGTALAGDRYITLASTTSTENSGLFDDILPKFTAETGIDVRVVAVGTGAAIRIGQAGDADMLLVHARAAEDKFVADGFGAFRRDVMHNDFVVIGPDSDPAGVAGATDATAALQKIAATSSPFLSRGDDSGTHKAELRLWQATGIDLKGASGTWYRETGAGMGETLNTATNMQAYALTDRGTWLSFNNRAGLKIVLEGDPPLFNPYGVILVNPARHPHVKQADAMRFIDWLTGATGQKAIAEFRVNGMPLFFAAAPSS